MRIRTAIALGTCVLAVQTLSVRPAQAQSTEAPTATKAVAVGMRMPVTVVAKQLSEREYSYVVPGYVSTYANAYANCIGTSCYSTGNASATVVAPREASYKLTGASLSLRLPDGRVAVVNCGSKLNWTGWTAYRSCRVPGSDRVEAEFRGEKAKLVWRVGIQGEEERSETYKLIEVLDPATDGR